MGKKKRNRKKEKERTWEFNEDHKKRDNGGPKALPRGRWAVLICGRKKGGKTGTKPPKFGVRERKKNRWGRAVLGKRWSMGRA